MALSKYRELYKKTGKAACLEMLAEECTELAHACLKLARKQRGENPTPTTMLDSVKAIHEEIADVEVVVAQIKYLMNCEVEVMQVKKEKIDRQLLRIEANKG